MGKNGGKNFSRCIPVEHRCKFHSEITAYNHTYGSETDYFFSPTVIHYSLDSRFLQQKGGYDPSELKRRKRKNRISFRAPTWISAISSLSLHLDLDLVFFFESKDKEGAKRGNREGGREGAIHFENRTRRNRFLIAAHYERKISTICLG